MGDMNLVHYRNFGIPSAGSPGAMIAPFWDNLYQTGDKRVYVWHDTTEHRYVIQWYDMPNTYSNAVQNFEVVLYDQSWHQTSTGDGMILFQYEQVGNTDSRDGYATVGIQNVERTDGLMYTYWNEYADAAPPLASGRAILFMPLGEIVQPTADVSPGSITETAAAGGQVVEYLHIGNTGEAGSQLNYTITKIDPLTRSGAKGLSAGGDVEVVPTSLEGSDITLNASEYEAGATVVLDVAATCMSPDWEWLMMATLDLPPGVSCDSATDLTGNHGTLTWNGATGDGATVIWGSVSNPGGYVENGDVDHADITLTFDPGLSGDIEIHWVVDGDNYGSPPHQVSGTIVLVPTAPAIYVTTPNTGDVAIIGDTFDVTFLSINGPESGLIELQREDGSAWETLAAGVTLADGSWTWPVSGDPGPWAVIRVTDEGDPLVFGQSCVFAVGRNLDWITLDASTGQVEEGQSVDVTVTLDAAGLSDGTSGHPAGRASQPLQSPDDDQLRAARRDAGLPEGLLGRGQVGAHAAERS